MANAALRIPDRLDLAPRFTLADAARLNEGFRGVDTQEMLRVALGEGLLGRRDPGGGLVGVGVGQRLVPAGQDRDNPPAPTKVEPYKTHLAYVRERRNDEDGEAILAEALAKLRGK